MQKITDNSHTNMLSKVPTAIGLLKTLLNSWPSNLIHPLIPNNNFKIICVFHNT